MSGNRSAHVTELLPEVALGGIAGEERGAALAHLAGCARCRRDLEAHAEVVDELLLLAPERQPPVGFEDQVVSRMRRRGRSRSPGRLRRTVVALAAALLGATAALGVAYLATKEQREFSELYARALDMAGGSYFGALPLTDAEGRSLGHVFGYEGEPSWVFVVVDSPPASGSHRVTLLTQKGKVLELGTIELRAGKGTLGAALPGKLQMLKVLRVSGPEAGVLRAVAPPSEGEG
jgi:hypothetical protein